MIKAPVASAPPAVVVKLHVAAALVLAATRSDAAIENEVLVTWPPIAPESMPGEDTVGSPLVAIVMPVTLPAVVLPMVKPITVTVTAVLPAIVVPPVVMTMEMEPGACGVRVALAVESVAVGAGDKAKKPEGYESVILLPAASAPPTAVVNEIVAAALVLPATRSLPETSNDVEQTELALQICPDDMPTDVMESALVDIVMPDALPAVTLPMVRPVSVMVTAALAARAVPPVVIKMDVAPAAPGDRVAPIVDSVAIGLALVAKKPEG